VGFTPPGTFAAGAQPLVNLNFSSVAYSNNAPLVFANAPIICQLVDTNAVPVPATFQNATLAVGGTTWPGLAFGQNGNSVVLSWPMSASVFSLQTASSLDGVWSNVVETPTTNGVNLVITSPISTNSQYFRLKY